MGVSIASGFYVNPKSPSISSCLSSTLSLYPCQPNLSSSHPYLPQVHPGRSLLFALRREINEPLLGPSLLPHLWIVAWLSFQEVRRFYEQHLLPEVKGASPPLHEWDTQIRNCSTKETQPLLLYSPGPWREQAESPCGNCRWIWHMPDPSSPNRPAEEQGHLHLRLQSQIPTARLSLWLGKPAPIQASPFYSPYLTVFPFLPFSSFSLPLPSLFLLFFLLTLLFLSSLLFSYPPSSCIPGGWSGPCLWLKGRYQRREGLGCTRKSCGVQGTQSQRQQEGISQLP